MNNKAIIYYFHPYTTKIYIPNYLKFISIKFKYQNETLIVSDE
jgi:hypothetical protein